MQYDIAAKRLLELARKPILKTLLHCEVSEATLLDELPQEMVSVKRTDFGLKIGQPDGREEVMVMEFQTHWNEPKVLDLVEYTVRFKRKHVLFVRPVMLLFNPSGSACDLYSDENLNFRFKLIKLWELEAESFYRLGPVELYPLVSLMAGGVSLAEALERKITRSELPPDEKNDLLTIFTTFLGLRDKDKAEQISNRRKDIMTESPIYQSILEEGIEEGHQKGLEEGHQEGLKRGRQEGLERARKELICGIELLLEIKFGAGALDLIPKIDRLKELEALVRIRDAIKPAQNLDEIRRLLD